MKKFYESLKGHAIKIINFKKKKMTPLTKKYLNLCATQKKIVTFANKKFEDKYGDNKKYRKVWIIVIIQINTDMLHVAYAIEDILYLKKFLLFLIMDQTMIIILS